MVKKYWLGILPHVYYVQKNNKALLYNTQSGEHIHTQNIQVIDLLERMHDGKNLGVIGIDEITCNQSEIGTFIKESGSKNICTIAEATTDEPKPIQLMPVLNLQKDVERLKQEDGRSFGEGILHYLSDVTVYTNHLCNLSCRYCNDYTRQFFHCSKSFTAEAIDFNLLKQFLKQLTFTFIRRLAITGGNVFLYPHFSELISFLHKEGIKPLFGFHCGNIDPDKISLLDDFPKEIFVTFPIENNFIGNIISLSKQDNTKIIFEISSEETYSQAASLVSEHAIKNHACKPFYNGENRAFFKEHVYLTKDDIVSTPVSQRMIFAHQKLNTNFFGRIHLFPNGDIKTHPLKDAIGNYQQKSLVKTIEKEIITNTAWRVIRDQSPCNVCIYQFLCPSPSGYEWVGSKNNLCTISF
jgi:pseudo-rSAM protein